MIVQYLYISIVHLSNIRHLHYEILATKINCTHNSLIFPLMPISWINLGYYAVFNLHISSSLFQYGTVSCFFLFFHNLNTFSCAQVFCRWSFNLGLSDVFPWTDWGYGFLGNIMTEVMCPCLSHQWVHDTNMTYYWWC